MHRRLHRRFAAAAGALALAAPFGGATAVAQPAPVEVSVEGIEGTDLVVTARCEVPQADIDLVVVLTQEAEPYAVEGRATAEEQFDCVSAPASLRLPITGDGVLVPGVVDHESEAIIDGRSVELGTGSFTADDEVTLPAFGGLPDDDTLPIDIDPVAGEAATGPVIGGTVTCQEPRTITMNVEGRQIAGRHGFPLWGFQDLWCDGETRFAVSVGGWWTGGLGPGPATVTVHSAEVAPDARGGTKTATVMLTNAQPEPDFRLEPTPDTSISFGEVVRVNGHLAAVVRTGPCEPGYDVEVVVDVRPVSVHVDDRWFFPERLTEQTHTSRACDGREQTHLVAVPDVWPGAEVAVEVQRLVFDDTNQEIIDGSRNQDTLPVSTK